MPATIELVAGIVVNIPGGDLLSHTATRAVSSALRDLTSVFEMGTGVTPSALPPRNLLFHVRVHGPRFYPGSMLTNIEQIV